MEKTMDTTVSRPGRDAFRAAGDGLTALGAVLVLLGVFRALIVLETVPDAVGSWWPALLVAVAVWLFVRGHRGPAATLGAIGVGLLVVTNVPGEYVWPALLIVAGVLLVLAATTGSRLLGGFPGIAGIALFTDRDVQLVPGEPSHPLIALFGEANGHLHGLGPEGDVVRCLAIFGEATLTVPHDIIVDVSPTAVFGDVRTPEPPTGRPDGRVRVQAIAIFGDVRIQRV